MPGQHSPAFTARKKVKEYIKACLTCPKNAAVGQPIWDEVEKAWCSDNLTPVINLLREKADGMNDDDPYIPSKLREWAEKLERIGVDSKVQERLERQEVSIQKMHGQRSQLQYHLNAATRCAAQLGVSIGAAGADNTAMQALHGMRSQEDVEEELRIFLHNASEIKVMIREGI